MLTMNDQSTFNTEDGILASLPKYVYIVYKIKFFYEFGCLLIISLSLLYKYYPQVLSMDKYVLFCVLVVDCR